MNKFKYVGLLLLAGMLAGCAAMQKSSSYANENDLKNFVPQPDRALIYVFRDKQFFGKGITSHLVLDGVSVAKNDPNEFSVVSVAPGKYSLFAHSADETNVINMVAHNRKKEALPLTAEAGHIYCYETTFAPLSGFTLKAVPNEEVQPKIKKAKWRDFQKL